MTLDQLSIFTIEINVLIVLIQIFIIKAHSRNKLGIDNEREMYVREFECLHHT